VILGQPDSTGALGVWQFTHRFGVRVYRRDVTTLRRHLNYANVVATLALLFAMSGGALAAKHYLITSTNQISPKVLRKLKARGKTGPAGKQGAAGAQGVPGGAGSAGARGPEGVGGPAGLSALSTLPAGESESGDFLASSTGALHTPFFTTVNFPVPLKTAVSSEHEVFTPIDTPAPHCSGPGHADPGYLCVYSAVENAEGPFPNDGDGHGTLLLSFTLQFSVTAPEFGPFAAGTYTVTAA
jgi:hypothetical protein